MRLARKRSGGIRGVFLTLAILALALKVIVPQGFMVAARGDGFPLVICTGHGVETVANDDHGSKTPAQKKSDAPCAFAGNLAPPAPSQVALLSEPYVLGAQQAALAKARDLMPGRGLAAPPPPSQGPPPASI